MFGREAMKIQVIAGLAFVALAIAASTSHAQDISRSKHDIERIEKARAATRSTGTGGIDPKTANFLQSVAWDTVQEYFGK